ncbi:hypothetical protein AGLY_015063 [Aphis glycines]|uniref:Uncharacterized protein n=1 Tax=Aphis glycines TaxID=307491 RepID=A0A6G0T2Z9_APHGL|nr:hypothetical protein AGLY_015063 [Aphis glycines]
MGNRLIWANNAGPNVPSAHIKRNPLYNNTDIAISSSFSSSSLSFSISLLLTLLRHLALRFVTNCNGSISSSEDSSAILMGVFCESGIAKSSSFTIFSILLVNSFNISLVAGFAILEFPLMSVLNLIHNLSTKDSIWRSLLISGILKLNCIVILTILDLNDSKIFNLSEFYIQNTYCSLKKCKLHCGCAHKKISKCKSSRNVVFPFSAITLKNCLAVSERQTVLIKYNTNQTSKIQGSNKFGCLKTKQPNPDTRSITISKLSEFSIRFRNIYKEKNSPKFHFHIKALYHKFVEYDHLYPLFQQLQNHVHSIKKNIYRTKCNVTNYKNKFCIHNKEYNFPINVLQVISGLIVNYNIKQLDLVNHAHNTIIHSSSSVLFFIHSFSKTLNALLLMTFKSDHNLKINNYSREVEDSFSSSIFKYTNSISHNKLNPNVSLLNSILENIAHTEIVNL